MAITGTMHVKHYVADSNGDHSLTSYYTEAQDVEMNSNGLNLKDMFVDTTADNYNNSSYIQGAIYFVN